MNTNDYCLLTYTFNRDDKPEAYSGSILSEINSISEITYYAENRRDFRRTYRMKIIFTVNGTLRKYDYYLFITTIIGYSGFYFFILWLFSFVVSSWYSRQKIKIDRELLDDRIEVIFENKVSVDENNNDSSNHNILNGSNDNRYQDEADCGENQQLLSNKSRRKSMYNTI